METNRTPTGALFFGLAVQFLRIRKFCIFLLSFSKSKCAWLGNHFSLQTCSDRSFVILEFFFLHKMCSSSHTLLHIHKPEKNMKFYSLCIKGRAGHRRHQSRQHVTASVTQRQKNNVGFFRSNEIG